MKPQAVSALYAVESHIEAVVADDSKAEAEFAAAAKWVGYLDADQLLALHNRCAEIMIPVEAPSGRNLVAWGAFTGTLLDAIGAA